MFRDRELSESMAELATKIFISYSLRDYVKDRENVALDAWVKRFKGQVCDLTGFKREEVYIYRDTINAPINAVIWEEVARHLDTAEHLICVVSDEYLQSVWCLNEIKRFRARPATETKDPIFVFTEFLAATSYDNNQIYKVQIHHGIDWMKLKNGGDLPDDIEKYAQNEWLSALIEARNKKRHVNYRSDDRWPQVKEELDGYLERPRSRFLVDYAELSAYCLGADRYRNGGWGFSMPEAFSYDDEDGDELPNGPYGLNVVVLRALSYFLKGEELDEERRAIFDSGSIQRNPSQAVNDRLPHFANFLACLENREAASLFIKDEAEEAQDSLAGFDPLSRWTLKSLRAASRSDEYHAAVIACLSKREEIRQNKGEKGLLFMFEKLQGKEGAEPKAPRPPRLGDAELFNKFSELVSDAIARNDLLKLLRNDQKIPLSANPRIAFKASILWLMLAGSREGTRLLSEHIKHSDDEKDSLVIDSIRHGIRSDNVESITMALAAFAATMACNRPLSKDIQNELYRELFQKKSSIKIVPKLNAVAWAAILLIASYQAKGILESDPLIKLWMYGKDLRVRRLNAVTKSWNDVQLLNKKNLNDQKRSSLVEHSAWWINRASEYSRTGEIAREQSMEDFAEALGAATFWGRKFDDSKKRSSSDTLSGVLRVNLIDNRIQLDSPGYSRIFLHPFGLITGMNVSNLNGIRREFGDDDAELVRIMGETVVKDVFVRNDNGYARNGCKFIERTREITELLRDPAWNRENGLDDLLLVLGVEGDDERRFDRWIHRSAIVQQPLRANADRVISWRFVELPPITSSLVLDTVNQA
jgi:hypothetical protein